MTLKSSTTTMNAKAENKVPLVRPAHGRNYQYVTTSPGEMLVEEFFEAAGPEPAPARHEHSRAIGAHR
jgi:hypothetical protein